MKRINNYIFEKLKINKNIKINQPINGDELFEFLQKYIFSAIQKPNIDNIKQIKKLLENSNSQYNILASKIHMQIWGKNNEFSFIEYLTSDKLEALEKNLGQNFYLSGGIYFWYETDFWNDIESKVFAITINNSDYNNFDHGFDDPIIIKII